MAAPESFHKQTTLAMVGVYATPLAVGLAGTGLIMAPLEAGDRRAGVYLLLFGLLFNALFIPVSSRLSEKNRALFAKFRATLNLWLNVTLVVLLERAWPPIWLILMLPAVGIAVYGTRQRTIATGVVLSAALFVINASLGLDTPLGWGIVAAKASFILLTSLMINDLVHASAENR